MKKQTNKRTKQKDAVSGQGENPDLSSIHTAVKRLSMREKLRGDRIVQLRLLMSDL